MTNEEMKNAAMTRAMLSVPEVRSSIRERLRARGKLLRVSDEQVAAVHVTLQKRKVG